MQGMGTSLQGQNTSIFLLLAESSAASVCALSCVHHHLHHGHHSL